MKLTRQGEYAIRAVIQLARNYNNGLIIAKEIALKQDIPLVYLTKILSILTKNGLVISQRGNSGGIKLAVAPSEISMVAVLQAVEGPYKLNTCLGEAGQCARKNNCSVHSVWEKVQLALLEELSVTFDKLI